MMVKHRKMDLIPTFIGSKYHLDLNRNNPSTKTAQKNLTNGLAPISTLVIGSITKNTASESNITLMEISMKEVGKTTKDMDRVHTGSLIQKKSSEGSTLEIGSQTKNKEGVPCFTNPETGTMVCGWIIFPMGRGE